MLSFTWKEGWGREAARRVELEEWNEGKGGGADAVNVWMEGWNGSRGGGREGGEERMGEWWRDRQRRV